MVDCEVTFEAGTKHKIRECLQKSLLYGDVEPNPFESTDRDEIKEHIKKILIDNIKRESNFNNVDELRIFYDILFHIIHLEAIGDNGTIYCEIASR